ncbi:5'-nucleotidase [Chryseobacterium sp. SORGH_AS909]|uniref:bifunctional metallophosphatase/5'-nucleotidase n=1 Tax=unclassified Chryseobacterium TaxID=2593645 RepID=UPI0027878F75|nr:MULTISPECIES: metallophosphatase [unclassified Chryseobacterium]MDQ1098966.1 5'-nucleotidase [Chryseobacterium sp. SORGH_AS_1048]MDR6086314.1 5'-nucleotidase [Chryseobacterium sp. SORGH_AS_0909]MDR6130686.1 5'-nucleotidase [Chryseobacterium sp. SORGH_AS_1175]MDT3407183.1 5'-nucleotidase [Pseudacidovorax intermedius]
MNRKSFFKTVSGGTLAMVLAPNILMAKEMNISSLKAAKKLTILHTNDQHSRIEPFDSSYKRNPNQGGFARRATLIQQIRNQENNVLLLDSGDIFQGTPYFNFFGGELEFKLMSMMKYDASTMGNHDFDNGLDGFLKVLPNAQFPFICSNYDFKNTVLDGKTSPYKIFNKNGIKVGLFGVGIELKGLVGKKQYGETVYSDPVDVAQHYASFLKNDQKCDLVICLSHIGYDYTDEPDKVSDKILAARTENIDLILGGHTHTFLPEPQIFKNRQGKNVLVNQVGWAGLLLGRIDFFFDPNKNIQHISWNNQAIDSSIIA